MNTRALLAGVLVLFFFHVPGKPARAQDHCPQNVLIAQARAGSVCGNLERGRVCWGNGTVEAAFEPDSGTGFDAPGAQADLTALRRVHVSSADDWSIAAIRLQANLIDVEQRSVTLLLFGEGSITNEVPYAPELAITASGLLYVRTAPQPDADIVAQLGLRDMATAIGRTEDAQWLRIIIPRTNQFGWVPASVLTASGDSRTLPVMDESTPYQRAFQTFTLHTGVDDAPCEGAPESGLLIQTPNTITPVELIVNGVILRAAATAFLQAAPDGSLTVDVLDGQVEVEARGVKRFVPAGAQTEIPLGDDLQAAGSPAPAIPYTQDELAVLPVNNLPYHFALPPALSADEIDALAAEFYAIPPTPITPVAEEDSTCVRTVQRNASLWAGPGMFYEIIKSIEVGTRVEPVYRVVDAEGLTWWQLSNTNWIRADAVRSTGECPDVPVTDTFQAPPTNTLSLETCETTNGPLRVNQRVTITFVPPAFKTHADAWAATGFDPGRITVGSRGLPMRWSDPIQIAEERFVRTFRAQWIAEAGTYRITGQRLSYIVSCDITVPLGR